MTVKLIPMIKFIHSIGVFRASFVYVLTIAVAIVYEHYIAQPFTAQLIKQTITR
jgi:hypothetical protein